MANRKWPFWLLLTHSIACGAGVIGMTLRDWVRLESAVPQLLKSSQSAFTCEVLCTGDHLVVAKVQTAEASPPSIYVADKLKNIVLFEIVGDQAEGDVRYRLLDPESPFELVAQLRYEGNRLVETLCSAPARDAAKRLGETIYDTNADGRFDKHLGVSPAYDPSLVRTTLGWRPARFERGEVILEQNGKWRPAELASDGYWKWREGAN